MMKMNGEHTDGCSEKEFKEFVNKMGDFCSAAQKLPGLAEALTGLGRDVFGPGAVKPEHHEKA